MTRLRTIAILAFIVLFNSQAKSQEIKYSNSIIDFFNQVKNPNEFRSSHQNYKDVEGSPYIPTDFIAGTVIRNDSVYFEKVPLRYNAYDDQIEFNYKNQTNLFIAHPEDYKAFNFDGKTYVYRDFSDTQAHEKGFFVMLEYGSMQLLKRTLVTYNKAVPPGAYSDPKPAEFKPKSPVYFLSLSPNTAVRIKNEKTILELAADKKNKLSSFIKKNKLKARNEDDLKKIVAYFNQL